MKLIPAHERWYFWTARYNVWFELWMKRDFYGWCVSMTIATFTLGFQWKWQKECHRGTRAKRIVWHRGNHKQEEEQAIKNLPV